MRPISSVEDLKRRVPEIQKAELVTLAEIGALNFAAPENGDGKTHATKKQRRFHRRDALWQVERVARPPGPLLEDASLEEADEIAAAAEAATEPMHAAAAAGESPLSPMTDSERLIADFRGTGMTVGPHPMAYCRAEMKQLGVRRASELEHLRNGTHVRVAGAVIAANAPAPPKDSSS